jgi:hypothetical protein
MDGDFWITLYLRKTEDVDFSTYTSLLFTGYNNGIYIKRYFCGEFKIGEIIEFLIVKNNRKYKQGLGNAHPALCSTFL